MASLRTHEGAIGQYVHARWENYKKFGSYEGQSKWNRSGNYGQRSDFTYDVFKRHKAMIVAEAAQHRQSDIKKLEKDYNASVKKEADLIKDIIKSKKNLSMLKPLLKMTNSKWSDPKINDILAHLEWDDKKDTWKYTGSGVKTGITVKKADTGAKNHRHIDTLVRRCHSLTKEIIAHYGTEMNEYVEELKKIQNELLTHQKIKKTELNIEQLLDLAVKDKGYLGEFTVKEAELYYTRIDTIGEKFKTVQQIQKTLEWSFAEITGNMSAFGINKITKQALGQLKKEMAPGKRQATPMRNNNKGRKDLLNVEFYLDNMDIDLLQEDLANHAEKSAVKTIKNKKGDILKYQFKTITSVSQKADIVLEMEEQSLGISMKNTLLEAIGKEKEEREEPQVLNLQADTTSLLTYLTGIQIQKTKLGTHYLNILAQFQDTDAIYSQMRQDANEALTLGIIYSALTGRNQGRNPAKGSPYANVLAVYDKTSSKEAGFKRIKLFDMTDIIYKLSDDMNKRTIINPSIESISLDNTMINGLYLSREDAYTRIDKLLLEARRKTLKVGISKQFLNSLYS